MHTPHPPCPISLPRASCPFLSRSPVRLANGLLRGGKPGLTAQVRAACEVSHRPVASCMTGPLVPRGGSGTVPAVEVCGLRRPPSDKGQTPSAVLQAVPAVGAACLAPVTLSLRGDTKLRRAPSLDPSECPCPPQTDACPVQAREHVAL